MDPNWFIFATWSHICRQKPHKNNPHSHHYTIRYLHQHVGTIQTKIFWQTTECSSTECRLGDALCVVHADPDSLLWISLNFDNIYYINKLCVRVALQRGGEQLSRHKGSWLFLTNTPMVSWKNGPNFHHEWSLWLFVRAPSEPLLASARRSQTGPGH